MIHGWSFLMIKVKRLKELLNEIPEDALLYGYEGEDTGIVFYSRKKKWFISTCQHSDILDTYTEGFEESKQP